MKPKDPAAPSDAMIACLPSPTVPAAPPTNGSTNEKRTDKKLKLTLEAGHSGSAVVLHCQGRIIFRSEARALSTIVAEVLPSARRMVVDLAGVDSVDSCGLGELVLTHMWAEAAGYKLKFASPKRRVRDLFEITKLVSVFDVYSSVPEAMAAMVQEEILSA
jgi:anti-sigma B factor antagonist